MWELIILMLIKMKVAVKLFLDPIDYFIGAECSEQANNHVNTQVMTAELIGTIIV